MNIIRKAENSVRLQWRRQFQLILDDRGLAAAVNYFLILLVSVRRDCNENLIETWVFLKIPLCCRLLNTLQLSHNKFLNSFQVRQCFLYKTSIDERFLSGWHADKWTVIAEDPTLWEVCYFILGRHHKAGWNSTPAIFSLELEEWVRSLGGVFTWVLSNYHSLLWSGNSVVRGPSTPNPPPSLWLGIPNPTSLLTTQQLLN